MIREKKRLYSRIVNFEVTESGDDQPDSTVRVGDGCDVSGLKAAVLLQAEYHDEFISREPIEYIALDCHDSEYSQVRFAFKMMSK